MLIARPVGNRRQVSGPCDRELIAFRVQQPIIERAIGAWFRVEPGQ